MNQPHIIICPGCDAANRVPAQRPAGEGRCGSCHTPLFIGRPLHLNSRRFQLHCKTSPLPLLVDFWAAWCGPCKLFEPVFLQAARQLEPRIRLGKVNTEEDQGLSLQYGVQTIPTVILFVGGRERARISGAMDLKRLTSWALKHL